MRGGFPRSSFRAPKRKDGPKAKARAIQFLCMARTIDGVTAEKFAVDYCLRPETAQAMLAAEQARRAAHG